jgi:hypothetical protein
VRFGCLRAYTGCIIYVWVDEVSCVLCVWVEERVEESVYGVCLGRRAFTVYFLVVLYNCKKYVWVNIVTLKALEVLKY